MSAPAACSLAELDFEAPVSTSGALNTLRTFAGSADGAASTDVQLGVVRPLGAAASGISTTTLEQRTANHALHSDSPRGDAQAAFAIRHALPTSSLLASGLAEAIAPNILSLAHWERLEQGDLYAETSRIDWVSLLRRTFEVDLRVCVRCGGRLAIRSVITDPDTIATLLDALRRGRAPPSAA